METFSTFCTKILVQNFYTVMQLLFREQHLLYQYAVLKPVTLVTTLLFMSFDHLHDCKQCSPKVPDVNNLLFMSGRRHSIMFNVSKSGANKYLKWLMQIIFHVENEHMTTPIMNIQFWYLLRFRCGIFSSKF